MAYVTYALDELEVKEIEFFWPGVITYGFPTFVNGATGLGKTNLFIKIIADASRGVFPPAIVNGTFGEIHKGDPIRCFYVSTENPVREVVYPAFLYNGGNVEYLKIQNEEQAHFILCEEDFEAVMSDFQPRLIVVDAFQEHLPDGFNLSSGDDMSILLRKLERITYNNSIALVLIGNDAKGADNRSDANKMLGSGVLARRARTLITVKEYEDIKFLNVTKQIGYKKKENMRIGYRFGANNKLEFYVPECDFYDESHPVVRFLKEELKDGPLGISELIEKAEKAGFTKNQLYEHRLEAGVDIDRKGRQSKWYR